MRRQWTFRGLVIALVAPLVTVTVTSSAAQAASGPSVPLPETGSVAVSEQTRVPRGEDEASRRSLSGDQQEVGQTAGSGKPTATSLSPSSTWDVSLNTGDFTWSYPLRVPPAPGGLEPSLALSYRSSAVDGHTSETNNQPSWIGDGWDLWPGYIERTYGTCADDDSKTGDLCWRSDNATAAYDGGGGTLIHNGTSWRAKSDDGSRIERFTGLGNGDDNGEHWRITATDGTQYWFGSATDAHSTWTVPVYGDDAGEPCNRPGSFGSSHCVQAWRWNLDKIVDRNGNVIRYYYTTETNSYGMNEKDSAVSYVRGGSLHHIDYGLHESVAGPATGRVDFTLADRCVRDSDCAPAQRRNWPDTPLKLSCTGATCTEHSPTFWTTKRLAGVTTTVWRDSSYEPVDRWTLDQQFPGTGDIGTEQRESAALWLKGITHTGLVAGSADLPPVTFEGTLYPNRVDGDNDGYAPLNRYRITGIISETGGVTSIDYQAPDCKAGQSMPAAPEANTMRCYPVRWAPPGHEPRTDYFHKYVVSSVIRTDMLASSAAHVTRYEYLDGAAWHWNMSEFTKDDKKTWNDFRGFGRVRTRTGSVDDPGGSPRTMSEQRFYRGMHNDRLPNGGRRSVRVSDSVNDGQSARDDHDWLSGFAFENTTFESEAPSTAPAPPVVSRTVSHPMWKGPTASRGEFHAYMVRPEVERRLVTLKSGGFRETRTVTRYDDDVAHGLPTTVDDFGDVTTAEDDRCVRNTYAPDTTTWQLDLRSRVETVSVNCGTTPTFPRDAVSDLKLSYDSRGNPARVDVAGERPAAGPVYVTTKTVLSDKHGRTVETTDALGNVDRSAYAPAEGGPVTEVTHTGPTGLVTRTAYEPASGKPVKVTDSNNRVTETAYDPLGRTTQVWLPNRPRSSNPEGSVKFGYRIARDKPVVVTTGKVGPNGVFVTSNEVYDGLLRPRQTQKPGVGIRREPGRPEVPTDDGRLITDTRYDSHGRVYKETQPYFNAGAVDTTLWLAADAEVPGLTRTRYDGAGRETESIHQSGAFDRWRKLTSYDGDRVHVTPPAGGTATTAITDALGRTTELRTYRGGEPEGDFDATRYEYTKAGDLAEVTAPDGAVWRYEHDLRRRQVRAEDPDSGTRTMTYDDAGRLTSTKDALNRVLFHVHDALGRKTALHEDSRTGKKLAEWTYDTANSGKGLPASTTRYVDGNAYTTAVDSYTALNKPLYASITIPSSEGALAGKYDFNFQYGRDGSLTNETYPRVVAAQVGEQTVTYSLDDWGRASSTRTGAGALLVAGTTYTRYGEVQRIEQGAGGTRAWQSFYYETNTRRHSRTVVDAELPKPMQSDVHYTYDDAGNITSMADLTRDAPADVQCFRYDSLRRLTEAWTAATTDWWEGDGARNGGCTAEPVVADGAAPYWHSYRHGVGGNRVEESRRTRTTTDKRTYNYPDANQPQPHTVRSVTSATATETYEYNAAGETTRRTKAGVGQLLGWDREGRLASVTENGKSTSFIYTADGARLLRKDPSATTLYLGKQEIRHPGDGSKPTVTRYYTHGAATIAMHDGTTLLYLGADHHGTAQVAMDTANLSVTRRRQTPYGAPRGTAVSWPGERGFVGGTKDPSTGLTHIGARGYDADLGRFLSVDPVMNPQDSQQMNGFAYSNNNPTTFSDPTGLWCDGCDTPDNPDSCYGNNPGPQCAGGPVDHKPGGRHGPPAAGNNGGGGNSGGGGSTSRSGCGGRGGCGKSSATPPRHCPPPRTAADCARVAKTLGSGWASAALLAKQNPPKLKGKVPTTWVCGGVLAALVLAAGLEACVGHNEYGTMWSTTGKLGMGAGVSYGLSFKVSLEDPPGSPTGGGPAAESDNWFATLGPVDVDGSSISSSVADGPEFRGQKNLHARIPLVVAGGVSKSLSGYISVTPSIWAQVDPDQVLHDFRTSEADLIKEFGG